MRFCPFCTAENATDAVSCAACNRRLPPPPNRRARAVGEPPTGMISTGGDARPATLAPPPRPAPPTVPTVPTPTVPPPTVPPPIAAAPASAPPVAAPPPTVVTAAAPPVSSPPTVVTATAPPVDDGRRALATALVPPPTALRRSAPPPEPRPPGGEARRKDDHAAPPAAPPPPAPPSDETQPVDDAWLMDPAEVAALTGRPPSVVTPPPAAASPSAVVTPPPSVVTPPPRPAPPSAVLPPAAAAISPAPAPPPAPPVLPPAAAAISPAPIATSREPTNLEPPPTRIVRTDGTDDRPFIPPAVMAVPEVPDHGLINAARYAVAFAQARWQRSRAVKLLRAEITSDTAALDGVLLTLGREARGLGVDNRVLADENAAITDAEGRRDAIANQGTEVLGRKSEENAKFDEIERTRLATVADAERIVADAQRDVTTYEAQRRSLREKRKDLERRQKAYLQAAEAREGDAEKSPMGDVRAELRRAAEGHRREAASLDPERQDLERKLASVERPLSAAQAKLEAAKAELDAAKRALADAREGHRHRLAELDAEHGRKLREHELAEAEIVRRLVTLGTLINLHRVDRPEFAELYQRIDRLRTAINARTTEIDRLVAERAAYDRPSLLRGYAVLAGVVVAIIALIAIILAAT